MHLHPLEPGTPGKVVQGLRALALARTTTAGEVSVLDLPLGPAVGTADLVDHDGAPAGLITLQLPLPQIERLLTLTLCTPAADRLPACTAGPGLYRRFIDRRFGHPAIAVLVAIPLFLLLVLPVILRRF